MLGIPAAGAVGIAKLGGPKRWIGKRDLKHQSLTDPKNHWTLKL